MHEAPRSGAIQGDYVFIAVFSIRLRLGVGAHLFARMRIWSTVAYGEQQQRAACLALPGTPANPYRPGFTGCLRRYFRQAEMRNLQTAERYETGIVDPEV